MMKKVFFVVLVGMLLLSACGKAGGNGMGMEKPAESGAAVVELGEIEAHDYWMRSAMTGENSAAYMLLHNHSKSDDALMSASSDVADAVELHMSKMDNGVMQMIPQESVPLVSGAEVEFKPGGLHVMFIGLKKDLKAGDTITLTLHFKNHEDIVLTVPVKDAADMGGSGMNGMNGMQEATPTP